MNLLKKICYYIVNKQIEQPEELGIGALVTEDVIRINPDKNKSEKDYTEHVYFAWQYFGVVVIVWFALKF